MREIKFRAYDKKHQRMYYSETGEVFLLHGEWSIEERYDSGDHGGCRLCDEKNVFLMQYTGLKDKNGNEIFEGDIISFTYWWFDGNEAESQLTGTVVYIKECASYGLAGVKNAEWIRHIGGEEGSCDTAPFGNWHFVEEDIEILGNIHENPELVEVTK